MWDRVHDGAAEMPEILGMARTQREADHLLGAYMSLHIYCAKHTTNGFVPEVKVRQHLRGAKLDAFVASGLLHRAGHVCECMKGQKWRPGMAFYVHYYLQWNPTKEEMEVDRAKRAELKDRELLAAIRRRDKDLCRYCGYQTKWADRVSGRGLVFDHVDPARACGARNLVVACKSCNSRKGARTPEAAGMTLLPEPGGHATDDAPDLQSPGPIASHLDTGWSVDGPSSGDGGAPVPSVPAAPTSRPINGSTNALTNGLTNRSTNGSTSGPTTSRGGTGRDGTGPGPDAGDAGPDGERDPVGPAPPRGSSAYPDPYRRSAITGPQPEHHAGLPRGPPDGEGHSAPAPPRVPKVLPNVRTSPVRLRRPVPRQCGAADRRQPRPHDQNRGW